MYGKNDTRTKRAGRERKGKRTFFLELRKLFTNQN